MAIASHHAVQDLAGRIEQVTFLREDRHAAVDDLHDVIGPDREGVVRRVPESAPGTLRSGESRAEAIECGKDARSAGRPPCARCSTVAAGPATSRGARGTLSDTSSSSSASGSGGASPAGCDPRLAAVGRSVCSGTIEESGGDSSNAIADATVTGWTRMVAGRLRMYRAAVRTAAAPSATVIAANPIRYVLITTGVGPFLAPSPDGPILPPPRRFRRERWSANRDGLRVRRSRCRGTRAATGG